MSCKPWQALASTNNTHTQKNSRVLEMQTVPGEARRGHVRNATHKRAVAVQVGRNHAGSIQNLHGCTLANIAANSNCLCLDVVVIHVTAQAMQCRFAVRACGNATESAHLWQIYLWCYGVRQTAYTAEGFCKRTRVHYMYLQCRAAEQETRCAI